MFRPFVSTCVLSCALLASQQVNATPTDDAVVVVNGKTITQQDFDNYVKIRAQQTQAKEKPDDKTLIEELVQRELLKQDAIKNKLFEHPEFVKKINEMRDNLLMAMAMHVYLEEHPLDDAMLQREYQRQLASVPAPKKYQVRHILLKTETEAKAIITELANGKSFGALAKEKSLDTNSAENNGELGWITKSSIDPEFGAAMAKLEKGKYTTTPVMTQYGWHIIQVDDIAQMTTPPFESVKDQLKSALQGQLMQAYVEGLVKSAKVEILKQEQEVPNK